MKKFFKKLLTSFFNYIIGNKKKPKKSKKKKGSPKKKQGVKNVIIDGAIKVIHITCYVYIVFMVLNYFIQMHNCYLGWFWDEKTSKFYRWEELKKQHD